MKSNKKCKNSMSAAVTGAIIGAGVVATGVVIMSDKKNQEKIKEISSNIKKQAQEKKIQVEKKVKKIKSILKNTKNEVKKI